MSVLLAASRQSSVLTARERFEAKRFSQLAAPARTSMPGAPQSPLPRQVSVVPRDSTTRNNNNLLSPRHQSMTAGRQAEAPAQPVKLSAFELKMLKKEKLGIKLALQRKKHSVVVQNRNHLFLCKLQNDSLNRRFISTLHFGDEKIIGRRPFLLTQSPRTQATVQHQQMSLAEIQVKQAALKEQAEKCVQGLTPHRQRQAKYRSPSKLTEERLLAKILGR